MSSAAIERSPAIHVLARSIGCPEGPRVTSQRRSTVHQHTHCTRSSQLLLTVPQWRPSHLHRIARYDSIQQAAMPCFTSSASAAHHALFTPQRGISKPAALPSIKSTIASNKKHFSLSTSHFSPPSICRAILWRPNPSTPSISQRIPDVRYGPHSRLFIQI